jgi:dephospho-CoA kinase
MIVVGLTGSIATGKSEVARLFRATGLPVFDADAAVHEIYDQPQVVGEVEHLVPAAVREGRIDRAALSQHLRNHPADFPRLEALIHPKVAAARARFLAVARQQGETLAVLDIPLLFEVGEDRNVDVTVVVTAPEPLQRARALTRPGMTSEKLDMILARQIPSAEKARRADYVLDNSGTLDDLSTQVAAVLNQVRQRAGQGKS